VLSQRVKPVTREDVARRECRLIPATLL